MTDHGVCQRAPSRASGLLCGAAAAGRVAWSRRCWPPCRSPCSSARACKRRWRSGRRSRWPRRDRSGVVDGIPRARRWPRRHVHADDHRLCRAARQPERAARRHAPAAGAGAPWLLGGLVWALLWGGILDRLAPGPGSCGFCRGRRHERPALLLISVVGGRRPDPAYFTVHALLFGVLLRCLGRVDSERNAFFLRGRLIRDLRRVADG